MLGRELPHATPALSKLWQERWQPNINTIREQALRPSTAAIALVGGTGAGKSTLVNAILGARILPVSNSRACTAAISEVSHAEGEFTAEIEFISRKAWSREVELLLADLADEKHESANGDGVSRAARDRLKAVYQLTDNDLWPGLTSDYLDEPLEIQKALNEGRINIRSGTTDGLKDQLRLYLDSKFQFWPLVKHARIRGPFPGLATKGIHLVDLPGLNDPNEAREEVTRQYLKASRFVWVVFNIKRALTRDIQMIMQSEDFARQIVMDGRDNALTFVGTASDDVDRESGIEEFGLEEDALDAEIVGARNEAVRKVVRDQLAELSHRLAHGADENGRVEELKGRLQRSQVYTVSARDYLHLRGIAKNKSATLDDTAQTEIPSLREHLVRICAGYTDEAHLAALYKQVTFLASEIKHTVQTEQQRLKHIKELTAQKRKEIGDALQRLLNFFRRDLDDLADRFRQDVTSKHELLEERLNRAFDRGRSELTRVTEGWNRIHWSTLRAIVRRGGRFNSPTSGQYDFAEDISRPVLESITFAWTDFFGDKMAHLMEVWADRLLTLADRHRVETMRDISALVGPDSKQLAADLEASLNVAGRLVKEYLGQSKSSMGGHLDEVRSSLYEQIPRQVGANMQRAYATAGGESGTGMKQRILEALATHARQVCKVMFDDARDQIMVGVRMVTDTMARNYKGMTDNLYDRLSLPTSNFFKSDPIPEEDGAATSQRLATVITLVQEVVRP
jgi:predicted GTPase